MTPAKRFLASNQHPWRIDTIRSPLGISLKLCFVFLHLALACQVLRRWGGNVWKQWVFGEDWQIVHGALPEDHPKALRKGVNFFGFFLCRSTLDPCVWCDEEVRVKSVKAPDFLSFHPLFFSSLRKYYNNYFCFWSNGAMKKKNEGTRATDDKLVNVEVARSWKSH